MHQIDPQVDRPWNRSGFKHPDIMHWVTDNRAKLVRAILTLIRAWMAAGRPYHATRLGSFDAWSMTVGGILDVAGIGGFLGNLDQFYEAADTDGQVWRELICAWYGRSKETPQKVGELNVMCEEHSLMLRIRGDGTQRSKEIRLGTALQSCRDRLFDGFRIVKESDDSKHKGNSLYALKKPVEKS